MKIKIAVIQFPGSNCEFETKEAIEKVGIKADIFRWNKNPRLLRNYAGFVIVGGFSYQDRVRAGVIAAKDEIIDEIVTQAEFKKPILGICNGCQILVEAGLTPGIKQGRVEMGLAPNKMIKNNEVVRRDYYCNWVYLKVISTNCIFTKLLKKDEILPLPVAHSEGRFVTKDNHLINELIKGEQIVFQYSTADGKVIDEFPINPNGSVYNIAGITNKYGNVLALMPHPERANYLRQVPIDLDNNWSRKRRESIGNFELLESAGPGRIIFEAMKEYITQIFHY